MITNVSSELKYMHIMVIMYRPDSKHLNIIGIYRLTSPYTDNPEVQFNISLRVFADWHVLTFASRAVIYYRSSVGSKKK